MPQNIEDLFLEAADSENKDILEKLLSTLKAISLSTGDIPSLTNLLLEQWGDSIESSKNKAEFCLSLCELSPPDTRLIRNAVTKALKKCAPGGFSKNIAITASGIKDNNVSLLEVSRRFSNLEKLKNGRFVFSEKENKWYSVISFDELTGNIELREKNAKKSIHINIAAAVTGYLIFEAGDSLIKHVFPESKPECTSVDWSETLRKSSLSALSDETCKKIAFVSFLPSQMNLSQFNAWWDGGSNEKRNEPSFVPSSARNIKELNLSLSGGKGIDHALSDDDILKISDCLARYRNESSNADTLLFAETISLLSEHIPMEKMKSLKCFENRNLHETYRFWPSTIENTNHENLYVWDNIPSDLIPGLARTTQNVISGKYLLGLFQYLPLRCLTAVSQVIGEKEIFDLLSAESCKSADVLLWIWKNRKSKEAICARLITMPSVLDSFSPLNDVSWKSSTREMKKLLLENSEFHSFIIKSNVESISLITDALRKNISLSKSDMQGFLVKLSRISKDFKNFLESQQGRGLISIDSATSNQASSGVNAAPVTSLKSYNMKIKELENIISIQLPENTAAIAHARSYGDLRENAEYAAAKERQRFLTRMKAELERDLDTIVPYRFEAVVEPSYIMIGSSVTIDIMGSLETYHILGFWDSNPEINMLSCDSALAKSVIDRKRNDIVVLPDLRKGTIINIESIPESLVKELNNE